MNDEVRAFRKLAKSLPDVEILVTGIGRRNSEKSLRAVLAQRRPGLVFTCGFAGGLRPGLALGDIIFSADPHAKVDSPLTAAGAKPGRFHCSDKIAATANEKHLLHQTTGADAVEMESEVIRAICHKEGIPSATVRVILDAVNEDLVLDFNDFMTPDERMDVPKFAWAIATSPGKIGALLRLQKQCKLAAEKLAQALAAAIRARS